MELKFETARQLYGEAPDWFKQVLIKEFGIEDLQLKEYELIKTFEDACAKTGENISERLKKLLTPDELYYKMVKIVVKAINMQNDKIWEPDWNDTDQRKWWPYFNLSSGFGFSCSSYDFVFTITYVGSRLCFSSKERCDYAATQFVDLYEQFLTIKK